MNDVTLDNETHTYRRGLQELPSVSSIVRMFPSKGYDDVDPAVLANANERGCEVDALLSRWIAGELAAIPAGVREDSAELFGKLVKWWGAVEIGNPQVQQILANDEFAGTLDIKGDGIVADLKTVYALQPTYSLQLGLYCILYEAEYGKLPERCGIIHVTKRFTEPKWVPFEVSTAVSEARVLLDFWRLVKRKTR